MWPLLVALVLALPGCADDGTGGQRASAAAGVGGQAGSTTPGQSAAASPAPAAAGTPAPPAPATSGDQQVVELSTQAVAGVPLGTAAADAERRLREELGEPTRADASPGCNGETGRTLAWEQLSVFLVDDDGQDPVLSGWSAGPGGRFAYRLPFGTRLGETAAATERRVPRSAGALLEEGPYAGSYVVRTREHPDLLWTAAGDTEQDLVDEVSFAAPTCD